MNETQGPDLGSLQICVVIISFARTKLLSRCVTRLQEASARCPSLKMQIRVLINGPDQASYQAMTQIAKSYPTGVFQVDLDPIPNTPAAARNRVISKVRLSNKNLTRPEWIYFIDDDAYPEQDHFLKFLESVRRFPQVAAIGGPNLTPPGSSFFQKASGNALSSPLGTSISFKRYRAHGESFLCDETALILCNLFVHRRCFDHKAFREDLACSEENWFLQSIALQGEQVLYNPGLHVWHERRSNLSQFATQVFKYGYGRGQTIRSRPWSARYFHLIPSIYLLSLLAFGFHPFLISLGVSYLGVCLIWVLFKSEPMEQLKENLQFLLMTPLIFPVIHVSYGLGVLSGLLRSSKFRHDTAWS